jgi:hypothetical protein
LRLAADDLPALRQHLGVRRRSGKGKEPMRRCASQQPSSKITVQRQPHPGADRIPAETKLKFSLNKQKIDEFSKHN